MPKNMYSAHLIFGHRKTANVGGYIKHKSCKTSFAVVACILSSNHLGESAGIFLISSYE